MDCRKVLAYISGTVDEELLLRNEYLAVENKILMEQLKGASVCRFEPTMLYQTVHAHAADAVPRR